MPVDQMSQYVQIAHHSSRIRPRICMGSERNKKSQKNLLQGLRVCCNDVGAWARLDFSGEANSAILEVSSLCTHLHCTLMRVHHPPQQELVALRRAQETKC
jgi:hypothetical protein